MDKNVRKRLEQDLQAAVSRLRQMSGAVAVEEYPGAIGDNSPFADEVDEWQANERREIGFATRERLVERVNRSSAALDRPSGGEYATTGAGRDDISSPTLRPMPVPQACAGSQ